MLKRTLIAAMAVALWGAPAAAREPPASEAPVKVAVLPVDLDPTAEGKIPALVDDIVLAAVQHLGTYEVIGQDDVNAMLGFEQQKEILGCNDAACMAQIGGALGVDLLVSLKIARLQNDWITTGKLINITQARVDNRISEFTPGSARDLLQAMPVIIGKLFGVTVAPMAPATEPAPPPAAAPAPPPAAAPSPPATPNPPRPRAAPAPAPAPPPEKDKDKDAGPTFEQPYFVVGALIGLGAFGTYSLGPFGRGQNDGPSFIGALQADWWLVPYIGIGLDLEYINKDGCIGGASDCGRGNWYGVGVQVSGGFNIFSKLKLFGRVIAGASLADAAEEPLTGTKPDTTPGLFLSAVGGVNWWFSDSLGLTATTGWARHTVSVDFGGGGTDISFDEFRLYLGLITGL